MSKLLTRIFFIILITPTLSYAATRYGIGPDVIKNNITFDKFQGSTFLTEAEKNIKTDTKSTESTTTKTGEPKKEEKGEEEGFFKKVSNKISATKDNSNKNSIERNAKKAIEKIDKFCKENSSAKNCTTEKVNGAKKQINEAQTEYIKKLTDPNAKKVVREFKTELKNILTTNGFKQAAAEVEKEEDTDEDDDDKDTTDISKTKEAQEKKVAELQENYDNMKEIENSFENRMLGATGMATMGIGGMQLATAMTEDRADEAAEQQMKAYLATFSCTYADGKRFNGGETAIELPGGNELINLYSEYVGLANDLKTRKEALNLRPGIESQSILDSATSGLYDDIATGKTSGAFTSLARALSDPNGADAAAWAAQREETAKQKKTALATIGIGAVATVAGNLLINRNNEKERSAEILEKYEEATKGIDSILKQAKFEKIANRMEKIEEKLDGTKLGNLIKRILNID